MARSILSFCLKLELGGQTTSLILFSKFSRFESLGLIHEEINSREKHGECGNVIRDLRRVDTW